MLNFHELITVKGGACGEKEERKIQMVAHKYFTKYFRFDRKGKMEKNLSIQEFREC